MKCEAHPDDPAVGECKSCGRGVCIVCKVMYDAMVHCRACVGSGKIVRPPSAAGPTPQPMYVYAPPPRGPHITSGTRALLYLLSLIPLLGIIIGLIYVAAPDRESRQVGLNCLVIGIVTTVVGCVCWLFFGVGFFYL